MDILKNKDSNETIPILLNFTESEKIILIKVIASMDIQEDSFVLNDYEDSIGCRGHYKLNWTSVLNKLLTDEEKGSAFGYMIHNFGWNLWNNLIWLFDSVFDVPRVPKGLSSCNMRDQETEEFKKFQEQYSLFVSDLIEKHLDKAELERVSVLPE